MSAEVLIDPKETEKKIFAHVLSREVTSLIHGEVMNAARAEIKRQLETNEEIKAKIREAILASISNIKIESPEATLTFNPTYREEY